MDDKEKCLMALMGLCLILRVVFAADGVLETIIFGLAGYLWGSHDAALELKSTR